MNDTVRYSITLVLPNGVPDVVHIYLPSSTADDVITQLTALKAQGDIMALDMSALTASVEANGSVVDSAVTLLNGLAAQLAELIAAGSTDPAALQAVVDQLNAESSTLAAAVAANTPAAEPPVEPQA